MNIRAGSPEEIAVSILAEIVQVNRARILEQKDKVVLPTERQEAKDPICGMTVDMRSAKHKSECDGNLFYFCCAGCKQTFDRQPGKYLLSMHRT